MSRANPRTPPPGMRHSLSERADHMPNSSTRRANADRGARDDPPPSADNLMAQALAIGDRLVADARRTERALRAIGVALAEGEQLFDGPDQQADLAEYRRVGTAMINSLTPAVLRNPPNYDRWLPETEQHPEAERYSDVESESSSMGHPDMQHPDLDHRSDMEPFSDVEWVSEAGRGRPSCRCTPLPDVRPRETDDAQAEVTLDVERPSSRHITPLRNVRPLPDLAGRREKEQEAEPLSLQEAKWEEGSQPAPAIPAKKRNKKKKRTAKKGGNAGTEAGLGAVDDDDKPSPGDTVA